MLKAFQIQLWGIPKNTAGAGFWKPFKQGSATEKLPVYLFADYSPARCSHKVRIFFYRISTLWSLQPTAFKVTTVFSGFSNGIELLLQADSCLPVVGLGWMSASIFLMHGVIDLLSCISNCLWLVSLMHKLLLLTCNLLWTLLWTSVHLSWAAKQQ